MFPELSRIFSTWRGGVARIKVVDRLMLKLLSGDSSLGTGLRTSEDWVLSLMQVIVKSKVCTGGVGRFGTAVVSTQSSHLIFALLIRSFFGYFTTVKS